MSIRWRLSLWFTLVLSGILIFSGLITRSILENYLNKEVNDNLSIYTARVHGTLHLDQVPEPVDYSVIHNRLPAISEFSSPGIYVQIIDSNGTIVVKSANLGSQELPIDPVLIQQVLSGRVGLKDLSTGDEAMVRIQASPLYLRDRTLVLEVGQSLKAIDMTMNQVIFALVGGVLAALLLSSLLGYTIVRKALSPVQQITKTAKSIEESSDLGRKVNYEGPDDEIRELATTFDKMIARLEVAFQFQKQFVADASHELRTPLTVIKGNMDLLKRDMSNEDRKESLEAIRLETERMVRIIDDLLVLAEAEVGQVRYQDKISLEEVLVDGLTRAQHLAENRKIILGRHDDLSLTGDIHQLKQMLGNLVDNAIKYVPDRGIITLSLVKEGDWARFDVSDTGPGIPPEHLPHIFERFYRVDKARSRARGGTGLGLAIVKQIAGSMGGRVAVTSEHGKGTTFTVWLRLTEC